MIATPHIWKGTRDFLVLELRHNWYKMSIFWELPYWNKLLIRHTLDVIHVVMHSLCWWMHGIKKKKMIWRFRRTWIYYNRKKLKLIVTWDRVLKSKATCTLTKKETQLICKWLKKLKFSNGYVSNIVNCNTEKGIVCGLKSHDCHVLIQRMLPVTLRDALSLSI